MVQKQLGVERLGCEAIVAGGVSVHRIAKLT